MERTHPDHRPYHDLTTRSRLDKAVNTLLGIVEGVAADGVINQTEMGLLQFWIEEQQPFRSRHPFNELVPVVEQAIADGVLSVEERRDLSWLCERLRSTEYYDQATADMQRLHGVLGGIVADTAINESELRSLSEWLGSHEHLRTRWPYDELGALVTGVLGDGRIDDAEHKMLTAFMAEFLAICDSRVIAAPVGEIGGALVGVCAACPEIVVKGRAFCFTGASSRYTRARFTEVVMSYGGRVISGVSNKLDYLIIGAEGNPCWAYACYGRKVEEAVALRKQGATLLLVHENDFHDAIADLG